MGIFIKSLVPELSHLRPLVAHLPPPRPFCDPLSSGSFFLWVSCIPSHNTDFSPSYSPRSLKGVKENDTCTGETHLWWRTESFLQPPSPRPCHLGNQVPQSARTLDSNFTEHSGHRSHIDRWDHSAWCVGPGKEQEESEGTLERKAHCSKTQAEGEGKHNQDGGSRLS